MKKVLVSFVLIFILISPLYAQTYKFTGKPTPINLTNPLSFDGTYEIERLIIRNGDTLLLDSDNSYDVYDNKGIATINMKISNNNIAVDLIYKMQMVGPAFKRSEISNYTFLYDSVTFPAERPNNMPISKALSSIGMTIYDYEDSIWEMTLEKGYTIILKLEKKSDITTIIDKKPFIIIEE